MPTTIDELQIEVEASASKADEKINSLTKSLEKLDKICKTSGLDKVAKKLEKIAKLNLQSSNVSNTLNKVGDNNKKVTDSLSSATNNINTPQISTSAKITEDVIPIPETRVVDVVAPNAEVTTSKLSGVRSVIDRIKTSAATAGTPLNKFSGWLTKIGVSAKGSFKSLSRVFTRVLVFGTAFRVYRMVLSGISEGLQNISQYSNETSTAMSKLSTNSLYLKNSIGAMLYPVIVAITPALESMTNAIVRGLNAINEFLAAWTGTDVFIKAQKVVKQYGDTAQKTANQIKKSFAGMDEITVIGDKSGGASASAQPDPSQMFEIAPISNTSKELVDKLKANLIEVDEILGGASLAIGAILCFSGANIPLGLGLMAFGAYKMGKAISEDWNSMDSTIESKVGHILEILSIGSFVVGAIIAFSGANIPLGIALMAGGALAFGSAMALNWEGISDKTRHTINVITSIISGALLALGIILVCVNVIPLGIGLIVAGAIGLATVVAANWDGIVNAMRGTVGKIMAIVGGALLVLGLILLFTGAGTPLGLGLILAGAVSLGTAVAFNWDSIVDAIKNVWQKIKNFWNSYIAPVFTAKFWKDLAIKCGNGLIAGFEAAINGIISGFESLINWVVGGLNKISIDIPDWVPGLGGKTFGINIAKAKLGRVSLPRFADGGFPDGEDGLFYANHNELVGKFSNGKTAVANNDQIVEGIRSGVYDANQEQNNLLREQNKLLRQLVEKDFGSGEIGVTTITNAINKKNRRDGKTLVPVGT